MIALNIKAKLSCPAHTRYNPEIDGEGFRAACACCERLWIAYRHLNELRQSMRLFEYERATMQERKSGRAA